MWLYITSVPSFSTGHIECREYYVKCEVHYSASNINYSLFGRDKVEIAGRLWQHCMFRTL